MRAGGQSHQPRRERRHFESARTVPGLGDCEFARWRGLNDGIGSRRIVENVEKIVR